MVRTQKIGFNSCECIKFLNIANFYAFYVWGKRIISCNDPTFLLHFFFDFATQLFSTLVTSSNLCNQAPLFTELRLLQATLEHSFNSAERLFFRNFTIVTVTIFLNWVTMFTAI